MSSAAMAQFTVGGTGGGTPGSGLSIAGDMIDNILVPRVGATLTASPSSPALNLGTFDIVIQAGSSLSGNAAALAAFNRAAQAWEARISNPVTITINADLASLGSGIIGSASSVILQGEYSEIRDQLVSNATKPITASLPTAAQFSATVPAGTSYNGMVLGTKANLKAMGFGGLDEDFGISDATITFSNSFSFDYDNSDGVGAGMMDFETVAAHEIGHALGFTSIVDSVNAGATSFGPMVLDLYRFANNTAADPSTTGEFTNFSRNLVPGTDAITDIINGFAAERRMSTGVSSMTFPGTDGRQASHWKADELTGEYIGMMDPTLEFGVAQSLTEADFEALGLIGYNISPVPEFSNGIFGLACVLSALGLRRRRAAHAAPGTR